jgi:hypothetical protein
LRNLLAEYPYSSRQDPRWWFVGVFLGSTFDTSDDLTNFNIGRD